jgi:hypothetical protein
VMVESTLIKVMFVCEWSHPVVCVFVLSCHSIFRLERLE